MGDPSAAGRGQPWLLLVEDNVYDEALALRAFRKNGFGAHVVVARDGVEALARLRDAEGPRALPRLVVLDLHLPRLDGFEVLRRLRARPSTRVLPVVVLSSSVEREDVETSYALGANSYIRKPVDFAALVATTAQLGGYWLGLNEPCAGEAAGAP